MGHIKKIRPPRHVIFLKRSIFFNNLINKRSIKVYIVINNICIDTLSPFIFIELNTKRSIKDQEKMKERSIFIIKV